ncbi:MAG: class I SAM-dependent methyltransferase [Chloroflexi bacterium]|nr:class I SAM-dependent methyltransferase [Chloroflexota bacterium]
MATHSHHPQHHDPNVDWAAMAADITREAEVLMPYLTETVSWLAALCRREGWEVRRVADIGSGPGVGTCVLAQQFDSAVVVAVDGSREMLERAAARAEALGLSARVRTRSADLPAGLDDVGGADLVWAAMVLHHVGDPVATLGGLRSLLEPGGVLAIVEFGDPPRFLPDDVGVGRPGLVERLGEVFLAGTAPAVDYRTMIEAAGFERIADRKVQVHLGPPLAEEARRVALGYLRRLRELAGERLDAQDRGALDRLMDEDAPLGIMRREDAFLDVSRQVYVARAGEAGG